MTSQTHADTSRVLGERMLTGGAHEFSTPEINYLLQLFQSLPAAIYTTDASGRINFFNEAAATLWDRRPVLGEEFWSGSSKLFWPDGSEMAPDESPMAVTLKTGKPVEGSEAMAARPDGSRYPFTSHPILLRDKAGQVIGAVNMLVDMTERRRHENTGVWLSAIVESSDDAIISKDLNGIITSWNRGAERLFGYKPDEIIGKPVLTLISPDSHDEEPAILARIRRGEKIDHYETVRMHKDGTPLHISLTVSPLKNSRGEIIGASKIARDITWRREAETRLQKQSQRLALLNQISKAISQDLDLERTVQAVTDVATQVTGAKFGAFFYNVIDDKGESYTLYTLTGAPRDAFDKFGMPRNTAVFNPTFQGESAVRSDDIRADPRYGKSAPHFGMPKGHLPVVSYLGVPVIGRDGVVLGGLFFGHDQPGIFTQEAEDIIVGIAAHAAIAISNARLHKAAQDEIVQRRRAEDTKALLLDEIQHRVKNTLGVVQAIASQTFRGASKEERQSFLSRIQALAGAHDLLTRQNWEHASVSDIVTQALAPFRERGADRFDLLGGYAALGANKALLLAMVLHELGTNAVKYGALSNEKGRVRLEWKVSDGKLALNWTERGGPPVKPPERTGFGSVLIERALEGERGRTSLEYPPEGVMCLLEIGL